MSEIAVEAIDPEWVELGDRVRIPKAWDAVSTDEPDIAGTIRVHVVYDQQLRRAAAASVRLDRSGEGDEVTTVSLREVRVQWVVQQSATQLATVDGASGPATLRDYVPQLWSRTDRSHAENLREAVTLYRLAATVNLAPLKLVSDGLRVSVSTATRMMARAREAGLAEDLITRETYNRIRASEDLLTAPIHAPGTSGPSIGR